MNIHVNAKTLLWVTALLTISLTGLAQGEGQFSATPLWSSGSPESGGDGIARLADFDRDGDLDLVTSAPDPMRWVIYPNQDGRLSKKPIWESEETTDCDHIEAVDFNGDGWMDLAATHESYCALYFNKWGNFDAKPDWETEIVTDANQIDFGDYDGDGDQDMLMASGEPINGVVLFESTTPKSEWPGKEGGPPTLAKEPTLKIGHDEYAETAIFGDFDNGGDGKLDVIAHYRSGKTIVYRNTGKGFDEGTVVYDDAENPWTQRHYLYDLDGDGQPELFAAKGAWGANGTSLQLAKKNGTPAMQVLWQSSPDTMFHAFAFGDVDGDGDSDVVASDYAGGGRIFVFMNEGGKLAEEPAISLQATGPVHEAVLGDLDLDGDLDLAAGGRDQAHIYENPQIATGYYSAANRAKPLLNAEFVFKPSVFSGSDEEVKVGKGGKGGGFPRCDFLNPDLACRLLGEYTIDVSFYSKDYEAVESPVEMGRYGAVVKITAEDGREYTRFRTLYMASKDEQAQPGGELAFPAATGVEAAIWHNQRQNVNRYISDAVKRDAMRSHDFAVLLAGLDEMGPEEDPESQRASAVTKDRQWWLPLKRKLNGNAERFAAPIVAPVAVDGLNARVLREGTEQEAGMKVGTAEKIHAVLEEWSKNSDEAFNATVARNGVVFFDRAYGSRGGKPITTETRHVVYSLSKAFSGSLMMMFIELGLVSLDDPIEKILPEFQREGVEMPATFHHVFTHTADTDGHFTDLWNDLEHVYGEAHPYLKIGGELRYNGTGIALGVKALEEMTGLALPQLYQEYLYGPLGCESAESIDGSAMTWSNAYDVARVGQMLANHGAYGNLRFFSEEVFQQMLPRKLDMLLGPDTDVVWGIGLTWMPEEGLSERTIGHGSASSCTLRVDLEQDLVIAMTRRTAGENFYKYHPKFITAIADGVEGKGDIKKSSISAAEKLEKEMNAEAFQKLLQELKDKGLSDEEIRDYLTELKNKTKT